MEFFEDCDKNAECKSSTSDGNEARAAITVTDMKESKAPLSQPVNKKR